MSQTTNSSASAGRWRWLVAALHLVVLWNLAVAQPIFDTFGRGAHYFVAERSQPIDILLLVGLLCLGAPLALAALEGLVGLLGARPRAGLHLALVAALTAVIALPLLKRLGEPGGGVLLAAAGAAGLIGAGLYARFSPVRLFLTYLAIALVAIPVNFLFFTDVSKIVMPADESVSLGLARPADTPVVMVVFDEFPLISLLDGEHQIDPTLYPNFAALGRDAYWFRNATTVADVTLNAVPAMLSGNYPNGARLPTSREYPHTLFTLLGASYQMHVFEEGTQLCPAQVCRPPTPLPDPGARLRSLLSDVGVIYAYILLPTDLTAGLPSITSGWNDFAATSAPAPQPANGAPATAAAFDDSILSHVSTADRPAIFERFVDTLDPAAPPSLYFLHSTLPHFPWRHLPSGVMYGSRPTGMIEGMTEHGWGDNEWLVAQGYQRHLLQVRFSDALLGDLLARLKETGLYDRALIVVVADHGVSFTPGECRRCATAKTFPEIMAVPLLIKLPNQHEGVVSDRNVETIDILPTIADALKIPLPWAVDGQSALDPALPERPQKILITAQLERRVHRPTIDEKYAKVERKVAIFDQADQPHGLLRIGRYRQLLGQSVDALPISGPAVATVHLEDEALLGNVDPASGYLPAQIVGRLEMQTPPAAPLDLAIAINGTVQAMTRTFSEDGGEPSFTAVAPEDAFRPGANTVEVLIVSGAENQPQIQRTAGHVTQTYTLTQVDGREALVDASGAIVPIAAGANEGWASMNRSNESTIQIVGWAVDKQRMRPADTVVVVADGRFLAAGAPALSKPDVVDFYKNDQVLLSGFRFGLPASSLGAKLRLFAVSREGVATELQYTKEFLELNNHE